MGWFHDCQPQKVALSDFQLESCSVPRSKFFHLTFGQVPFEGPNIHRLVQKILMGTVYEAQIFGENQQL